MALDAPPCVLVIAGSDSSGGAGIARDIETIAAIGGRTCLAVTAITVQTHAAVRTVETLDADLVAAQMRAALEANPVAAIKIGMLASREIIAAVSAVLGEHRHLPVVLDPVFVSSSGGSLLSVDAIESLKQDLMPLCRLVTPNLPELALLAGASHPAAGDDAAIVQARTLLSGKNAILIKGGHAAGPRSTDLLVAADGTVARFDAPRLSASMRGTGCMLASAIAIHLAAGHPLDDSIRHAKAHVFDKLRAEGTPPAAGG
ncbi:hydroxymethylpyrimidine/phosphomethylpyrimidine kinase [Pararhizobium antarcticum]|uniref:hydroxymethylpyrimidine kinase n=1 Tax=Pararhizobium antarcticum TaxID=1798805 RepID=A0A657LZN9_9HYPH|nr:hydroxymethylpyrimidine/phosphomethylpyrimidine kinase [Pararhizobium antarcticum]OJG00069.1 hydroxymethylpyrimidine/phosphomethylpyrimidine kinase [Rhizobium sp. 58]OJG01528.1 hydroxymethylpyrimidine/phosphomethylpyrimidine kinase [Pararhizobium antarcticum]